MPLKIYNSLTRKKEDFLPLNPPEVKMYVCGPTVYDEPHIGHLRSAYIFEMIRRYLESPLCHDKNEKDRYKVKFVRNITDVDDKIIQKAKELKKDTSAISEEYYSQYKQALKNLGIYDSQVIDEPRATHYIDEMKIFIVELIQKGYAYSDPTSGDVYFQVDKFSKYGELSGQNPDAMRESIRIEPNEKKKNPLDFALWKSCASDERPSWKGPIVGVGRPGWHIECSAMSRKCLGDTFDIHGGGQDLIFPHHENEIAQTRCLTGEEIMAKYWVHHGLVTVNGQKMSKSLKNYVTLNDIVGKFTDLKFLFMGTHYRHSLDYSDSSIKMAHEVSARFLNFFRYDVSDIKKKDSINNTASSNWASKYEMAIKETLDDDFNTPQTLTVMHEMLDDARKSGQQTILEAEHILRNIGSILGGLFDNTDKIISLARYIDEQGGLVIDDARSDYNIDMLIKQRSQARKDKNFTLADKIKKELMSWGITLRDKSDGTTDWYKPSNPF